MGQFRRPHLVLSAHTSTVMCRLEMGKQASAPLARQRQLTTRLTDLPMAAEQAHQCVEGKFPNNALRRVKLCAGPDG